MLADHVPDARKVLEIGCLEGRASTWLAENAFGGDPGGALYCLDSWGTNPEYIRPGMDEIEARFDANMTAVQARHPGRTLVKRKGLSQFTMAALLAEGHGESFDFIYIDGSHRAQAVLADLVLAFRLCRVGGLIGCDDYLWEQSYSIMDRPKLAIDAFANCYTRQVRVLAELPLYQLFLKKIAA